MRRDTLGFPTSGSYPSSSLPSGTRGRPEQVGKPLRTISLHCRAAADCPPGPALLAAPAFGSLAKVFYCANHNIFIQIFIMIYGLKKVTPRIDFVAGEFNCV
ncbi:hypothetical protein PGAG_00330 [Phaeocystis globosa virus 12T]|nr:hypothetical protein PGAG_00330 [Phaeocystis globosa virus 12T]